MNAIRELRKAAGMSRRSFAEYLNIPLASIQQWEQGVSTPPDDVISRIAGVMKADGYPLYTLTPHEAGMLRQTEKTLALENMHISPAARRDLVRLSSGDITLEDYFSRVRERYTNGAGRADITAGTLV